MNIKKYLFFLLTTEKPSLPAPKNVLTYLLYRIHALVFWLLRCCSVCYRIIIHARILCYKTGIFTRISLPCPVISIGNITTGGTGKTPTVIEIATLLRQHGKRVVILSRGYRRNAAEPNYVVLPDSDVRIAGDEPLLIVRKLQSKNDTGLPDIPVIVGSQRSISGTIALEQFHADVILLDDGFQHVQLARTCDIVLIDATNPFGGGYMLPAGFLREPLIHLARAHIFVITRSDEVEDIAHIAHTLRRYNPDAPIFRGIHAFDTLTCAKTGETIELEDLMTKRLLAVSGLANPASFLHLLDRLKLRIVEHLDFPDHHWYTEQDVNMISEVIADHAIKAIITTEKDQTKLFGVCSFDIPIYGVSITMNIHPKEEFRKVLYASSIYSNTPCKVSNR